MEREALSNGSGEGFATTGSREDWRDGSGVGGLMGAGGSWFDWLDDGSNSVQLGESTSSRLRLVVEASAGEGSMYRGIWAIPARREADQPRPTKVP